MKAHHPKLWFDLTTSVSWSRPAVGVVRVEQECCRQLLVKLPDQVRLCVYDQRQAQFLELDKQRAWSILTRDWSQSEQQRAEGTCIQPVAAAIPPSSSPRGPIKRLERVLRSVALAALHVLPNTYQAAARNRLIAIRQTLAFGYHQWKAAHVPAAAVAMPAPLQPSQTAPSPAAAPAQGIFGAGDCYLTMGLDWDHDKMEHLYREKCKAGLKVFNFAHDIIPVKFPHFYPSGKFDLFSVYFANMAWTADHIFCNSWCTARDLGDFFERVGAPNPPKSVVRLGDVLPQLEGRGPSEEVARLIDKPYLLFVSTIEIRKNHETLYKAYVRLIEQGFDVPTLVFVGMAGWRIDDFMYSLRNDPRVQFKIVILDHVTDSDLSHLYKNCLFTLYPSLYEGWGLPVAESLAYGKFCLAARAASIPEVAGDVIDYADPWSVPEWTEKIRLYCSNPQLVAEREKFISEHFRITSWEATVDQMLEAVQQKGWGDGVI